MGNYWFILRTMFTSSVASEDGTKTSKKHNGSAAFELEDLAVPSNK